MDVLTNIEKYLQDNNIPFKIQSKKSHGKRYWTIDNDIEWRSDLLYSDDEGMNWYVPDTAVNQLPATYASRQYPSVVTDDKQNIYIIGGQSRAATYSDVYRGYLNQLKWDAQHE